MRKIIGILLCLTFMSGCAAAEQEVVLPGNKYVIDVPDWMDYSDAIDGNTGVDAYVSADLEMDYFSYSKADAVALGMADTLRETA